MFFWPCVGAGAATWEQAPKGDGRRCRPNVYFATERVCIEMTLFWLVVSCPSLKGLILCFLGNKVALSRSLEEVVGQIRFWIADYIVAHAVTA
eukprot:5679035-Amphidinium_carterae.1